ncbi:MAG: formate dehydrogenase accessory sulfurtransferase FdhD [Thermodesulfobacteriota bacterium]
MKNKEADFIIKRKKRNIIYPAKGGKTMDGLIQQIEVSRCTDGRMEKVADRVIQEDVLGIRINGALFFRISCSLEQPENLAAGFLFTQQIVKDKSEIELIVFDREAGECRITLRSKAADRLNTMDKSARQKGSSGGLLFPESNNPGDTQPQDCMQITCDDATRLIRLHHDHSRLFKMTGAVHSCALCSRTDLLRFYEDIGRHNALDKMAGDILLNGIDTADKIVTASCRLSLEIIQKVAVSGFSMVISNSAPTYPAVKAAESAGICVIGFARNNRFNLYTHPGRIISREP